MGFRKKSVDLFKSVSHKLSLLGMSWAKLEYSLKSYSPLSTEKTPHEPVKTKGVAVFIKSFQNLQIICI